jgi:hypothetical protein
VSLATAVVVVDAAAAGGTGVPAAGAPNAEGDHGSLADAAAGAAATVFVASFAVAAVFTAASNMSVVIECGLIASGAGVDPDTGTGADTRRCDAGDGDRERSTPLIFRATVWCLFNACMKDAP